MIDHCLIPLLRQIRSHLEHKRLSTHADRALVARINQVITTRRNTQNLPPAGPIERAARRQIASIADLSIDPGERQLRAHGAGIEIRCWYLVRQGARDRSQEEAANGNGPANPAWAKLPTLTRHILYLSRRQGFDGSEIAFILGLSRRTVRAHLRRALIALGSCKAPPP
ncbi:sigma factor-like helix-turn-helix DNA-binding protein [Sphingobium yanoikuyae]|uniref:RNA polymerase sigma factor 70 region 4 type 2 domain-containing protein n=1 Tax=Sphingobium yanoikuyae TaxID=13690 RepID=A0A291N0G8_SPHYA|nr:sigma-70 region 4 domain-containing protein [Sphingobium yanoikuyae]ATI80843.1 hypothetical protein A6768_13210 [Sphingobium yanoikuyae]